MKSLLTQEELFNRLNFTHILIDSCIWLEYYEYTEAFEPLIKYLQAVHCNILTLPIIKFEVLRSQNLENYQRLNTIIDDYALNFTGYKDKTITEEALNIARIYKKNSHTSASFIDCYMISIILSLQKSPFILTENHKDFTSLLFDPIYIHPVPIQTKNGTLKIYTPCIYEFNKTKYSKELAKLSR